MLFCPPLASEAPPPPPVVAAAAGACKRPLLPQRQLKINLFIVVYCLLLLYLLARLLGLAVSSLQQKRVHYAAVARRLRKTLVHAAVGPRVELNGQCWGEGRQGQGGGRRERVY